MASAAGAVSTAAALTVQPPVDWYVTTPLPLPPVVLRFVVPPALRLVDTAATVNAACGARTVTVNAAEVTAEYVESAALVAVTVQVPPVDVAVKVVPLTEQAPVAL